MCTTISKQTGDLSVPTFTKCSNETDERIMKSNKYSHDYQNNLQTQEYLPDELKNSLFISPKQL
jgi:replication-associated recombination protein RarA